MTIYPIDSRSEMSCDFLSSSFAQLEIEFARLYPRAEPRYNKDWVSLLPAMQKLSATDIIPCIDPEEGDWAVSLVQTLLLHTPSDSIEKIAIIRFIQTQTKFAHFVDVWTKAWLRGTLTTLPHPLLYKSLHESAFALGLPQDTIKPPATREFFEYEREFKKTKCSILRMPNFFGQQVLEAMRNWNGSTSNPDELWRAHYQGDMPSEWYWRVLKNGLPAEKLAQFLAHFLKECTYEKVKEVLSACSHEEWVALFTVWFSRPELFQELIGGKMFTDELVLSTGGRSISNYARWMSLFPFALTHLNEPSNLREQMVTARNTTHKVPITRTNGLLNGLRGKVGFFGRTLLAARSDGMVDAYKVQKQEPTTKLLAEWAQNKVVKASSLPWKIATSIQVLEVSSLPEWIIDGIQGLGIAVAKGPTRHVLHYQASHETFIFLNDPSIEYETFCLARRNFLRGTAHQIRNGIYPVLADMFHNEDTKRQYIVLTALLSRLPDDAGRLDAVTKGFRHPNVRLSGNVDYDDFYYEEELRLDPTKKSADIDPARATPWKLRANAIAELILVDACLILTRWHSQGIINYKDPHLVSELTMLLQEAAGIIASSYAGQKEEDARHFFTHCGTIWEKLAKQLLWSFQQNQAGLVGLEKQNPDLSDLYDPRTKVDARQAKDAPNWVKGAGPMSDKRHLDIGLFNGPLPWTELQKHWYIMPMMLLYLAEPKN